MAQAARTAPRDSVAAPPSARPEQLGLPAGSSWMIPLVLAAGAFILRVHDIGHESLWLDEGYTLLFSRLSLANLFLVGGAHEHPPLYYLLVHSVLAVKDSYLVPRVISALAGALSVAVMYLLGRKLFGVPAGLLAAILLAVAPFHLWYSRDGRGYELAGLMVLLSYLFLFEALDHPRRRSWAAYAVCLALCLYAEYTTIFVLIPQLLLLVRARERGLARPLAISWLAAVLLFLPWIGTVALDALGIAGDYWIPAPNPSEVGNTILEFFGLMTACPNSPCSGRLLLPALLVGHDAITILAGALLAGCFGALAAVRRNLTVGVLVLWLALPFVIVLAIALFRSLYLDRIFLDATFPLYLLIAYGVVRLRALLPRLVSIGLALLLLAASIANLQPIYAGSMNPNWTALGRDLGAAYGPGQSVLFNPGVLQSLVAAYLPGSWHPSRAIPLWSQAYVDVPGWQKRFPAPFHPSRAERQKLEARLRNVQLGEAARGNKQVWLVTYDYPGLNDSRRWFADRNYQPLISQLYDGDTRLELWSPLPARAYWKPLVPDSGFRGWHLTGNVHVEGQAAAGTGSFSLKRAFSVSSGRGYTISVGYQGAPPASKPGIEADVYDSRGRLLATYPRTQWYDFPINGVWLSQPFGFVAPPGAAHAELILRNSWGEAGFRHVAVYRIGS